jgi:uncharacterized phage-associated protein
MQNNNSSIGPKITATTTASTSTTPPPEIPRQIVERYEIAADAENRFQITQHASAAKRRAVSMKSLSAEVVADAIVEFCNGHGIVVTNLGLQKLLYYAQAWFLALDDKPLFPEMFYAHDRGPVQPDVFNRLVPLGVAPITHPLGQWTFPPALTKHVTDVMEVYGRYSAFDLERLSCDEEPWKSARRERGGMGVLSNDAMKYFYRSRINGPKK